MSQSDQLTAALHVNVLEGCSNADEYAEGENIVRNADQAVRLTLARGTDTLTTGVRDPDAESATLSAFAGRGQIDDSLSHILSFPKPRPRPAITFHALQEWEGYVVNIGETDFVARLVDLTAGSSHEEEEADIPLAEISDDDAARMRAGSIFRWVIGYERSAAGTKKRVSEIVFRDLPTVTKTDLLDGVAWARETIRSLDL